MELFADVPTEILKIEASSGDRRSSFLSLLDVGWGVMSKVYSVQKQTKTKTCNLGEDNHSSTVKQQGLCEKVFRKRFGLAPTAAKNDGRE